MSTAPSFVYVTYIETTPEKLWEALTNSEFSKRYWFGTEVRSDWKVGSPFAMVYATARPPTPARSSKPIRPRRLSYTFHHSHRGVPRRAGRRSRFNIEPHGKLVKLTVDP